MTIGLDIRMIHNSGIGTTIRGLLDHFTPEQRTQLTLFGPADPKYHTDVPLAEGAYPIYGLRQHLGYGRMLNRKKLSLFHMPHYDVPYSYRGPLVVTVHDLIHYLYPQYSSKPFSRLYSKIMLSRAARRAKKIITVSRHTEKDLISHFPEAQGKTVVLYPAADARFKFMEPAPAQAVLDRYFLKPGFLLYVGNIRPSKNSMELVKGYISLRREKKDLPPLVMVGANFYKGWNPAETEESVRIVESVEHHDLPAFYSSARAFIFPSLYEGFGLPPLEAMSCGVPVICSSRASLPEVCGEAALYLSEPIADEIARKIKLLLNSEEKQREMREKGFSQAKKFSWKSFAEGTWKIYREASETPS